MSAPVAFKVHVLNWSPLGKQPRGRRNTDEMCSPGCVFPCAAALSMVIHTQELCSCTIHSVLLYHMHHNVPTKKTSRSTAAVGQHGEDGRQPDKLQCPTILKYPLPTRQLKTSFIHYNRTLAGMHRCRACTSSHSGPHRRLWRRPNAKPAQYPATSSQLQAQQQPNRWDFFNHPSWTSSRPLR